MDSGFLEKLIERIDRIGPGELQTYLLRLAREKGFLETIFNAIHEGVIVTGPDGRINFLNESACGLFGLEREQCLGKPLQEKVRGLDWDSLVASEKIVSRDMEVFYPQNRFLNFYVVPLREEAKDEVRRRKDEKNTAGKKRERDSSFIPHPLSFPLDGYAIILRDITETRRSAKETIESERLSALTLLAAGVAHELGNPLNSLHIHLQLMERKARKLPENARKDLQASIGIAKEEIKRLDYIVSQFLRAIRPTPLQTQPENLNTLVSESVSFLTPEIKDRDILVEQDLRSDLPLVEVDRHQIKQAIYNIIKNSLQAMSSGGLLRIQTGMDDNHVALRFTDTGGGIPAENMGRIFDPYFTTKAGGSGLGLMIIRRIVREHGGEIDIVNDEGRGISLTIRLPLRDRRVRLLEGRHEEAGLGRRGNAETGGHGE